MSVNQFVFAQYYLRGEIRNEKNIPLTNVKIFVHSNRTQFFSGVYGSFGINIPSKTDSLTFSVDGYETQKLLVKAEVFQNIILKLLITTTSKNNQKLISVTTDVDKGSLFKRTVNDETYFQLVENEFITAEKYPLTGFSLSVNKAAYSNVRRFINMGSFVPPDAVKTEEMVNYFNLHYREPKRGDIFNIETQLTLCPWDTTNQLLYLNVSAKKIDLDKVPPGNFVFLIDVSGSMDLPNRLPLLKSAFQLFVKNLRAQDKVSIVMYGGTVGIWLQPTSGSEKEKIARAIEELTAAGDTPGESAIRTAYRLAESTFIPNGTNRVILATDGDFNVGETSEKALDELISSKRQSGVYLTCLGVGMGNFKDSKLQTLAKKGNGNYAYLDNIHEAEKVLVTELTQTLYAVAEHASVNVSFNKDVVKAYRLIGFDNKKDALASSTFDLEGGEIGSGNSTLAIFQIVPATNVSKAAQLGPAIGSLTLKYNIAGKSKADSITLSIPNNFLPMRSIDKELSFAAAITMFALKIKQSKFAESISWGGIKSLSMQYADPSDYLQLEFLQQVDKAKAIYEPKLRKKKKW